MKAKYSLHLRRLRLPINYEKRKTIDTSLTGNSYTDKSFSCGVDRWPEYYPETGRDIWIDSVMRQEYLWYRDMPSPAAPDYFQKPEAFLKKPSLPWIMALVRSTPCWMNLFRAMVLIILYIKCLIMIQRITL